MAAELGEYKVAWIKGDTLHSQMTNSVHEARLFVRKNHLGHYTIMRLIDINQGHYRWTLLPDGRGWQLLWMKKYWLAVLIVVAFLGWKAFKK